MSKNSPSYKINGLTIKRFTVLLFLISIFFGSAIYMGMNFDSAQIGIDKSDRSSLGGSHQFKTSLDGKDKNVKISTSSDGKSLTPFGNGLFSTDSALIETENKTNSDQFQFVNYDPVDGPTSLTAETNASTVISLSSNYNYINGSLSAYVDNNHTNFENEINNFASVDGNAYQGQSVLLNDLIDTGTNVEISNFSIIRSGDPGDNWTGEVWNATLGGSSGTQLIPHMVQATNTINAASATKLNFEFPNVANFNTSNTYSNTTGGYIFFIFYRDNSCGSCFGSRTVAYADDDALNPSDGDTYLNRGSTDFSDQNTVPFDWNINYTKSVVYNPEAIATYLEISAGDTINIQSDGSFSQKATRSGTTSYNVYSNNTKTTGMNLLFNITYSTSTRYVNLTNSISYLISPLSDRINWTIYFQDSYYINTGTNTKYFVIPANLIVDTVYFEGTSTPFSTFSSKGYNQTVSIDTTPGQGNLTIVAHSTNLFTGLAGDTYRYNGSQFETSVNATMGLLYPSEVAGDRIIANFTTSSLDITNGAVNASLRTETGEILGDLSVGAYIDQYNYSSTYAWNGSLRLETVLDPDMPTGVYSYQFIWSNATAAGAIYLEVEILPSTTITLISDPDPFNGFKNTMKDMTFGFRDNSHNTGSTYAGQVEWTFGPNALSFDYYNSSDNLYYYTSTLDLTSIVDSTAYTLNVSFSKGIYTNYTLFTMNGIEDNTDPTVVGGVDESAESENSVQTISWTITETYKDNYTLYRNGSEMSSGQIQDTFNYDVNLLDYGYWNFTLVVQDKTGNIGFDTIFFDIFDTTDPVINTGSAALFREASLSNLTLSWSVAEFNLKNYSITMDTNAGQVVKTGNLDPDVTMDMISIPYNLTNIGIQTIILEVFDQAGNSDDNTITLTITDSIAPSLNNIEDHRIFDNQTDYELQWMVTDIQGGNYQLLRNGSSVTSGTWISGDFISNGVSGVGLGVFNYTLIVIDGSGNTSFDTVILTIKDSNIIETNDVTDLGITEEVYEGDIDLITGNWTEFVSEDGIEGATVSAVLQSTNGDGLDLSRYQFSSITDASGEFVLQFNYANLNAGDYIWVITFSKPSHENKTFSKVISVLPHSVLITLDYPDNLVKGENFTILITVIYTTFNGEGLGLNAIGSRRSGGVANITVRLEITYINAAGEEAILTKDSPQLTNGDGITKVTLTGDDTNGINSLVKFSASIINVGYISSDPTEITDPNQFPTIQEGARDLDELVADIQDFAVEYWMYLLIGFISLVLAISLLGRRRRKRKQKREQLLQEMEVASEEIKAIQSITAILGKNTESGIPFFYVSFDDEGNVDMSLVSGLTTALSSFLSEMQEGATGFETMERQGISLTSHRLHFSDLIVVSKDPLPMHILQYIQESHEEIEDEYKDLIGDPAMTQAVEDQEVFEILVKNDLKIDLKEHLKIDSTNIKRVQNDNSYSKNIRANIGYLREFDHMVREANLPLNLNAILDYLESLDMNEEIASRIILVARSNGIIYPDYQFEE